MASIKIDGKNYTVVETLSYTSAGRIAKVVKNKGGEKVAVKESGKWRFWTAEDRLRG